MMEMTGFPWNGYKSRRSRSRNVNKWHWMPSKESRNSTTPRADANTSGDCCKEKDHWFPFYGERKERRKFCWKQESRPQALHRWENQRPPLPLQSQRLRGQVL